MKLKKITVIVASFTILLLGFLYFNKNKSQEVGMLVIPHSIEATTTPLAQPSPSFIAIGDVMLGRHVESLMNTYGDNYPFVNIDNYLNSANTVVANLEGPILENHAQTPDGSFQFSFDQRMANVIYNHNIKIVNLANNHTYDYGIDGFNQTTQSLDQAHVLHAGNPFEIGDAYILHTQIAGKKFLFLGFNITNPEFDFGAAHDFVKNLQKDHDEFVIAMVHGGTEYATTSNAIQQTFYRNLIDDGVDLVLAHHPHVVEEVEDYNNHLIFYSLGNFIFDQYFSQDVQQELTVKITFSATSTLYELNPVESVISQPQLMGTTSKQIFLNTLAAKSSSPIAEEIKNGIIDIIK